MINTKNGKLKKTYEIFEERIPPRIRDSQGTVVQMEGFAPGKAINLTPYNIVMMQWFIAKYGYGGDLSDFINDAIEDFFKSRNWSIKIIEEKILP